MECWFSNPCLKEFAIFMNKAYTICALFFIYGQDMDTSNIRAITPDIAKEYLKFKAQETPKIVKKNTAAEDPKRFLSYREELIPSYFSEE